jgi:hypothetical protein
MLNKRLEELVRPLIGQHVLMVAHLYVQVEGVELNETYFEKDSSMWSSFTAALISREQKYFMHGAF